MAEVDRVWYLRKEGEKGSVGPFSTEQLLARWQKGELDRNSEGWREGMLDWRPLLEIEPFTSAARVSLDVTGVIRFYCECNNEIVMAERFAGRLAKCSVCGREVRVPDPYAPTDPDAEKTPRELPGWLLPVGCVFGLIVIAAVALQLLGVNWMGLSDATAGGSNQATSSDESETLAADDNETPDGPSTAGDSDDSEDSDDSAGGGGTPARGDEDDQSGATAPPVRKRRPPPVNEGTTQTSVKADERNVARLAAEYVGVFRTKNPTSLERLEELLSKECSITHSDATVVEGRDANLLKFAKAIDKARNQFRLMSAHLDIESTTVQGDTAVVAGELVFEGVIAGRNRPEKTRSAETIVFMRQDGDWKITKVTSVRIERKSTGAG